MFFFCLSLFFLCPAVHAEHGNRPKDKNKRDSIEETGAVFRIGNRPEVFPETYLFKRYRRKIQM